MADVDESAATYEEGPGTHVDLESYAAIDVLGLKALRELVAEGQRHRYRTEKIVARGGMGAIEQAFERTLERRIAVKRLHEAMQENEAQARMFVREARVTGQLQHPAVVPVHDLGVDDEGDLYYAMELVEGKTLEELIEALPHGPIDRATLFDLLDVVVKVADALAYAHRWGVLHCDVKPANVMVGEFGRVYLMDWGIARFLEDERRREPGKGSLSGTPSHMAPEQARCEGLDARSDVFSLGALLYHIVTRRPPFQGTTVVHTLANAHLCAFPRPGEVEAARGTPPSLLEIIERAMRADRDARYQSVSALRDDLVGFMRGLDAYPRIVFAPGEVIVSEGDPGEEAFVIERGRCEVHREVEGERRTIRFMEAGEVFGEMSILSPGPRTASVTAVEPTTLLRITKETLLAELDSMKPWMGALVRTLADRFRERESNR